MESGQAADAAAADFEALVHRQSRFVFQVAYAMLRNSHDAEDIVQETFMNLYRNRGWRGLNDERAFLARAAWRHAVDRIRRRSSRKEDSCADLPDPLSFSPTPEELVVAANSREIVHRLIDSLPEELRQPLALSTVQELNSREIAVILGIAEGTVRTRLMRARQMLKEKLSARLETRYAK